MRMCFLKIKIVSISQPVSTNIRQSSVSAWYSSKLDMITQLFRNSIESYAKNTYSGEQVILSDSFDDFNQPRSNLTTQMPLIPDAAVREALVVHSVDLISFLFKIWFLPSLSILSIDSVSLCRCTSSPERIQSLRISEFPRLFDDDSNRCEDHIYS